MNCVQRQHQGFQLNLGADRETPPTLHPTQHKPPNNAHLQHNQMAAGLLGAFNANRNLDSSRGNEQVERPQGPGKEVEGVTAPLSTVGFLPPDENLAWVLVQQAPWP